jgi:hypothetical protein
VLVVDQLLETRMPGHPPDVLGTLTSCCLSGSKSHVPSSTS